MNQTKATASRALACQAAGRKAIRKEALENIRVAIQEYLAVVDDLARGEDVREVEVTV